MSEWAIPNQGPTAPIPADYRVAGMGRRVGAWILDRLLSGFLGIIPVVVALATGAVTLNQQALDQIDWSLRGTTNPFVDVTAPLIQVHMGPLILAVVVYLALSCLYYAGSWMGMGGTPCQRGLGLRVLDVSNGSKLSFDAALLRWALIEGLATAFGALFLVVFLDYMAKTPTNEWLGTYTYGSTFMSGSFGSTYRLSYIVSGISSLWLVVLIVSAGRNPARRGLHDRIVGSIVVARAQAAPTAWPGYSYAPPAAPPQPWPGYQPQGPGYPPQGPGYPPPPPPPEYSQGYPPPNWPGYSPQPWPGYPPGGTPTPPPDVPTPPAGATEQPPGGAPER